MTNPPPDPAGSSAHASPVRPCAARPPERQTRPLAERRQALLTEVLQILNEPVGLPDAMAKLLAAIQRESGLQVVAMRLKQGDDYPYYVQYGLDEAFVAAENALTSRRGDGDVCREADGRPSLACTCGLVLRGRMDASHPLFTARGSFWSNDTRPLLALPAEQDPRQQPRNRCIHAGFCSVALIPIRAGEQTVGLLQLNDRRADRFTIEMIHFFESLCDTLGLALARKQAEDQLQKSEQRHRAILRSAMDGFVRTDMDCRLCQVNDAYCRMSGYTEQELLAMNIADLEACETPQECADRLQQLRDVGAIRFESRHRRKDGSVYPVEVSAQYKHDVEGDSFIAFCRDISARVKADEALEELRWRLFHMERVQTMGELASSLAHEVSQPLAGILGNAQAAQLLLAQAPPDLAQMREILADIVADDRRAGAVVSQIRAMLRKVPPRAVPFGLNEAVREITTIAGASLRAMDVSLQVELAEGLPPVYGDKTQIQQVMLNLLLNAGQALQGVPAAEGQALVVVATMREDSGAVRVAVRDTGPGITREVLGHLFEPFFTSKPDGLGMGLAICRSIVTAHGGRIWAEHNPDGGACFTFCLPCQRD